MSCSYPKLINFSKGKLRDTIFDDAASYCLKPISHFKSSLYTCLSLLTKQNIILKTQNQDFPPRKIEYVNVTEMIGEIDFIFVFGSIWKLFQDSIENF